MSSIIFEQVSSINKNNYKARKQVIEEDSYHLSPRFDRAQSFYGKATIDDNDGEIILTSYQTPILKIKDGEITWLCKKEHLTQTTMRHIRDFLKQMDYENKINLSGKDYPITKKWVMDRLPKEKVVELWAAIHTFFSEIDYDNIKVIIPFDRSHIQSAFDESDSQLQRESIGNDYIDKTFDVVFRVSLPRMSAWKSYFGEQWNEAFGEKLDKGSRLLQIYEAFNLEPTPALEESTLYFPIP